MNVVQEIPANEENLSTILNKLQEDEVSIINELVNFVFTILNFIIRL